MVIVVFYVLKVNEMQMYAITDLYHDHLQINIKKKNTKVSNNLCFLWNPSGSRDLDDDDADDDEDEDDDWLADPSIIHLDGNFPVWLHYCADFGL